MPNAATVPVTDVWEPIEADCPVKLKTRPIERGSSPNGRWQKRHGEEKQKLLRMDFSTFRNVNDESSNANGFDGPKDRVLALGVEPLAARFLPIVGPASATATLLRIRH
jgi:hypothetical protein